MPSCVTRMMGPSYGDEETDPVHAKLMSILGKVRRSLLVACRGTGSSYSFSQTSLHPLQVSCFFRDVPPTFLLVSAIRGRRIPLAFCHRQSGTTL